MINRQAAEGGSARILVIDDDEAFRGVVRRILEGGGHSVTEAANGSSVSALLRDRPADLVITDIFMPDMDGIETILQIRKEFPAARIIAMSDDSAGSMLYLNAASKLGADSIIAKPFPAGLLLSAVTKLLARGRRTPVHG